MTLTNPLTGEPYTLPGEVVIDRGRPFAIMKANMKQPWVWFWRNDNWVSLRPYKGHEDEYAFYDRLPAEQALMYGVETKP